MSRRWGNSLALAPGEVLILTGSNMAGKSTFLRAVGLASVLAWVGGAVPAASLRIRPLRPVASMRIGDQLQEGLSTFYAEVRRLRLLLDAVEETAAAPALVLIDEMLRGTNNRERLAGARAFSEALAGAHAASMVATHDLALTELAAENARVRNAHFREEAEGDRLVFDYRLREGPCPTTNALVIMQRAGLPVPSRRLACHVSGLGGPSLYGLVVGRRWGWAMAGLGMPSPYVLPVARPQRWAWIPVTRHPCSVVVPPPVARAPSFSRHPSTPASSSA